MKSDWVDRENASIRKAGQGNSLCVLIAGPAIALLASTTLLMFLVLLFAHGFGSHSESLDNVGFSRDAAVQDGKASRVVRI